MNPLVVLCPLLNPEKSHAKHLNSYNIPSREFRSDLWAILRESQKKPWNGLTIKTPDLMPRSLKKQLPLNYQLHLIAPLKTANASLKDPPKSSVWIPEIRRQNPLIKSWLQCPWINHHFIPIWAQGVEGYSNPKTLQSISYVNPWVHPLRIPQNPLDTSRKSKQKYPWNNHHFIPISAQEVEGYYNPKTPLWY